MENGELRVENKIATQVHDPNGNSSLLIVHSSFSISTIIGKIPRLFLIFLRGNW